MALVHMAHFDTQVQSHIFWLVETGELHPGIRFFVPPEAFGIRGSNAGDPLLALSQHKDNWLSCALVWVVIFWGQSGYVDTPSSARMPDLGLDGVKNLTACRTARAECSRPATAILACLSAEQLFLEQAHGSSDIF